MKTLFSYCLAFSCLLSHHLQGQNEQENNWYFGVYAGLNFSTSPPTVLTDGKTTEVNSTATVSDENGNLLFYTDGGRIWNRNHQFMTNGTALDSHDGNYAQHLVVVRKPLDPHRHYIFHISNHDYPNHIHRLNYTVVNMEDGDGVVEQKNVRLNTDDLVVKIHAIQFGNGNFWVITQGSKTGKYYCFKGDENGINPTPIIYTAQVSTLNDIDYGAIKFSPDGTMVAVANQFSNRLCLFKFNSTTGDLSDPIFINAPNIQSLEFSASGKFLYTVRMYSGGCEGSDLYQYSLATFTQSAIDASKILIGSDAHLGMLQLGPDKKIYIGKRASNCDFYPYLGIIASPENAGSASGFSSNAISLGAGRTFQGLPNFARNPGCPDFTDLPDEIKVCNSSEHTIDLSKNGAVTWNDGTTATTKKFTTEGTYWVDSRKSGCLHTDTFNIRFINFSHPQLRDTIICGTDDYTIDLTALTANVQWQDANTSALYTITEPGTYTASLSKDGCAKTFSFEVIKDTSTIAFQGDTAYIFFKPVKLSIPEAGDITWQDGSQGSSLTVSEPGSYSFTAVRNTCVHRDTIQVVRRDLFVPNVITVNNDSKNDAFVIQDIYSDENWELMIYNRSGKLVYSTPSYQNTWAGDGVNQTYFFLLSNKNYEVQVKGWLQVKN